MINDLPENISSGINLYADDCCLWESGLNLDTIKQELQNSLDKVTNWCSTWGFRVNVNKSAVVNFTRRRKLSPTQLTVNNSNLPEQKEYRYLGLTLDSRLNYRQHARTITQKVEKRFNLLRLLSGTSWGASRKSLLTMYRAFIRPVMEYGFEAYLFSPKYVSKAIQRLQNSGLRICSGAMASTPVCVLQHSCRELPVHIRHLQACLIHRYLIISSDQHPCHRLVQDTWHEIFPDSPNFITFNMYSKCKFPQRFDVAQYSPPPLPPWTQTPFKVDDALTKINCAHADFVKRECEDHIQKRYGQALKIFTDGSKHASGCGAAFVVPDQLQSGKVSLKPCNYFYFFCTTCRYSRKSAVG